MRFRRFFAIYLAVVLAVLYLAHWGSQAVTTWLEDRSMDERVCFIIDPGHGGIDGGATSCTGMLESHLNLRIALRLDDLLHFLGYQTQMVRSTDTSIYTEGDTIAAQKVSDLKNRVKLVNSTANAILVSIHQNTFSDSRYSGAQVFYAGDDWSRSLGQQMQSALVAHLSPDSKRQARPSKGIYLMQHIERPGILVECGFLSNPEEDAKLKDPAYQKKLICVIGTCLAEYIKIAPLD